MATTDSLKLFSPATRAWFRGAFAMPTPAQHSAWTSISSGAHTLVVAPTGSGKTLSAFLWAIDRLVASPEPTPTTRRCRVLYISPMKALATDVERNLRAPLVGIAHTAEGMGLPRPDIRVALRTGDSSPQERRAFAARGADILITTPESLYLLLTSRARESLTGVESVILDEVHALAGNKRGAHLALSLERLDALLARPAQRIGLSATVRPVEEISRFLAGGRPVTTVCPPSAKKWDLQIAVPVPDLDDLGGPVARGSGDAGADPRGASIWPHVEQRVVDLIAAHRTTLVFVNSRRLAERLTARLNEIWEDRLALSAGQEVIGPDMLYSAQNAGRGAPAALARAHHGSVSKDQRSLIEDDLKAGRLPAVVATSSLELGIDMGTIDLVIQIESPPGVSAGLQRIGRAGHQVGAISHGVILPKHRGDLLQAAVIAERMLGGLIEELRIPRNPLDVLAQQIVAMTAMDDWTVEELHRLLQRSAPYSSLSRPVLDSVLDMLSGRYPSAEFAELRPRLVWDRITDTLTGRPGSQRLAVTSGGTIPDRGLFGVFLAGDGSGRRVGELDEEMVYESRVGDIFLLGTSSWQIVDITHDQVLVSPAPGRSGRLPFWKGDAAGRPAELGAALGARTRELLSLPTDQALAQVHRSGLDPWAAANLLAYLDEQRAATGVVPDDRSIVVERFRDEIGDWQVVVHSPYGNAVHSPWALVIAARMRERLGVDVQAVPADDGIVLRLLDVEVDSTQFFSDMVDILTIEPEAVSDLVTGQIGESALFASRFRECAARSLLLPRYRPDRRQALWQQRQRSAQLLAVAARYPAFPVVLEAVRECTQEVFDVPALIDLMRRIEARQVRFHVVDTSSPSPYARTLSFGYIAHFLYEGDSPLAERQAAALSMDPALLADLLGQEGGVSLSDLLDPAVVERTQAELLRRAPDRRCRDAEDLCDLLRRSGPASTEDLAASVDPAQHENVEEWLDGLTRTRRVMPVRLSGEPRWAVVEDAGRLRDALGVMIPAGVSETLLAPTEDPLSDLVHRYARCHVPFTTGEVAAWLGLGPAVVSSVLARLVASGHLVTGDLRPGADRSPGDAAGKPRSPDYCDAEVLRLLRRRSLAALRAEVEPSPREDLARLLPAWQSIPEGLSGPEGVLQVVEQLCALPLPASVWETAVLPSRVRGYVPGDLDELLSCGEVLWQGHGSLAGKDGWVSWHLADSASVTLSPPRVDPTSAAEPSTDDLPSRVMALLDDGGAFQLPRLATRLGLPDESELLRCLWDLVWSGRITNDSFTAVRALTGTGGRSTSRSSRSGRRRRTVARPASAWRSRTGSVALASSATGVGRWAALPAISSDATQRAWAQAEILLDRYGVLTRGSVAAEDIPGGFAGIYRTLSAAEEAGRVRRGYFVEGLGAAQFATVAAIDRLRALRRAPGEELTGPVTASVLASTDPANPYGAALPWPEHRLLFPAGPPLSDRDRSRREEAAGTGRAARKVGTFVVLYEGVLVLHVERGGRSVLCFADEPAVLAAAAAALSEAVHRRLCGPLLVERVDGQPVLGSKHPLAEALGDCGFHLTPRGLRLRR